MKQYNKLDDSVASHMGLKICQKCCQNCKWICYDYEGIMGCGNRIQVTLRKKLAKPGYEMDEEVGAWHGIQIGGGNVCDYHEPLAVNEGGAK